MEHVSRQVSMHEIDPTPLPDDPENMDIENDKRATPTDPTMASEDTSSTKSWNNSPLSPGLGLSHNPIWYLLRIQRYSSYTFTAFATAHVTNTSILPLLTRSTATSEPYLLLTRPYYQSPLLEPLFVLAPVLAHVLSGVAIRCLRRSADVRAYGAENRSDRKRVPWPAVSGISWSGYAFVPLLAVHVGINRVIPGLKNESVGLGYVGHQIARFPVLGHVGYSALVSVGVWHFVWGWAKYLSITPGSITIGGVQGRRGRRRRWWGIHAVAAVVSGLWIAGGLGVVGRNGLVTGWMGREFDDLLRSVPVLGNWL